MQPIQLLGVSLCVRLCVSLCVRVCVADNDLLLF